MNAEFTIVPQFASREEAMKALKRDHHLGPEPVAHINKTPEQIVCRLRYQFEREKFTPGRPSFQIGHHMMGFGYREVSGHTIKEPDGSSFREPDSGMKLNGWIDLIIEYRRGPIRISVNGHSKTYKHENVTVDNQDDEHGHRFTFKGGDGSKIVFDSVRLWECSRGEYLQVVH